jgi:hypothetical protein
MTQYENQEPIDITKISLGWEIILQCGTDESEARTLYENHRRESICPMLLLNERGIWSIWTCRKPFWPFT